MERPKMKHIFFVLISLFLTLSVLFAQLSFLPIKMLSDDFEINEVESISLPDTSAELEQIDTNVTIPAYPTSQNKINLLVHDLVRTYCWRGPQAWDIVQKKLDELEVINTENGQSWRKIMEYWEYVNTSMVFNDNILPDGLNDTDSMCLLVMGYALLPNGEPKKEFVGRLDAALNSAEKYPNARILCTGGNSSQCVGISEADVAAQWLIDRGVDPSRIILESKSMTTYDNIRNSTKLLSQYYPEITDIAIISSDYHVRCATVMLNAKIVLDDLPFNLVSHAASPTSMRSNSMKQVQMEGILTLAGLMLT